MLRRDLVLPPDYVFPPDEWRLVEKRFSARRMAQFETLFSTANGYLGVRGACEEGRPAHRNATLISGFHETWPIVYGETAFGFARTGQTIVNVPDAKIIRLYVDDEPFTVATTRMVDYERALDMKAGTLDRRVVWETPAGKRVRIESRRLVSFEHRHVAAIEYEVTVENEAAAVDIVSEVRHDADVAAVHDDDPRIARGLDGRVLCPERHYARDQRIVLSYRTGRSGMTVAVAVDHVLETQARYSTSTVRDEDGGRTTVSADARPGVPIRLTKYITYHTSRTASAAELCERAERTLDRSLAHGFAALLHGQATYMADFWRRADVRCEGNAARTDEVRVRRIQQIIRLNLFHILQACGRAEGTGVPAKGLTGEGYEGHYFWDTEIYVLPFVTYTTPRIARNLLRFRTSFLDQARQRAREVNQRGALFPWRTINGEEASSYYAAGTAQYHINADVVHAIRKYVDATGDETFLHEIGAEVLVETARLWRDLGFFCPEREAFCIAGVTGPDEYNTVVNNNTFTNLMARENLRYAASIVRRMREDRPDVYAALVDRTGLGEDEPAEWQRAADAMYLPVDATRGIHLQDDEFLEKKPWDFANTPPDRYPLLLHYHPLVIYRHQVIKQADVVLAMLLLGNEFTAEAKKRNFDFYDPLTTGDSSLSVCIQSILASEIGYADKAIEYARYAALMDLADIAGNVKDGCHIASMGGTWMVMVFGFGGFRDYDGRFTFRPRLPSGFRRLRFPLTLRGQLLEVDVAPDSVTYTLREGEAIEFHHGDEPVRLTSDEPLATRRLD